MYNISSTYHIGYIFVQKPWCAIIWRVLCCNFELLFQAVICPQILNTIRIDGFHVNFKRCTNIAMEYTVIITVLLVSLSSSVSTAPAVYYVKPTPDTKCPGSLCFTLSEYAQNASQYFTSSGIFHFLPGNHTLDRNIPIYEVSSVSFVGEQDNASQPLSWITCTEPAFFNLTQVQVIKIHALGFRHCGTGVSLSCTFYFRSVHRLQFSIPCLSIAKVPLLFLTTAMGLWRMFPS